MLEDVDKCDVDDSKKFGTSMEFLDTRFLVIQCQGIATMEFLDTLCWLSQCQYSLYGKFEKL